MIRKKVRMKETNKQKWQNDKKKKEKWKKKLRNEMKKWIT